MSERTARGWGPATMRWSTWSGESSADFSAAFHASSPSGTYFVSPNRSSHAFERGSPGSRQRSMNSSVVVPTPRSSASTGPSSSEPTRIAAAASPPADSSALVGRPLRSSELTTSTDGPPINAASSAPFAERTAPPKSYAGTVRSSRSTACMVVALVLSRYAGDAVANASAPGSTPPADASASRAASTPIVVVSSSYDATARVPLPPPLPKVAPIWVRSSRQ